MNDFVSLETWCNKNGKLNLLIEWDYPNNQPITPKDISAGSSKKVHWVCSKGHKWEAIISNRTKKGSGCPYCAGNKAISGINDFKTLYPELADEWNYFKNGDLRPEDYLPYSEKKVWWTGKCGHEWQALIKERTVGNNCPYCAGKRVLYGFNDFETWCKNNKREDLLIEWDKELNINTLPKDILPSTNKKYNWVCHKCGYKWRAIVNSRTRPNGTGCPACGGQKVIKGRNDLETIYPEIAKEWNYEKNEILPSECTAHSDRKVWWLGKCGHIWQDSISHRTGRDSGCPVCYQQARTSFPEQTIFYYVKKYYSDAINGDRDVLEGKELDVFIPSRNIAIEYDGEIWHESKEKDELKNNLCKEKGIKLFRIREKECPSLKESDSFVQIVCKSHDRLGLETAIFDLLKMIDESKEYEVNISKDYIEIHNQFIVRQVNGSLSTLYPELAKEWHPIKNGDIKPNMVKPRATYRAWWLGKCGHEWQSAVYSRTANGSGCPYCSTPARKLLKGFNDLEARYPQIAKEWHPTKNAPLLPSDVLAGNRKKVWWLCPKCGNEYLASPSHRVTGTACPKCAIRITAEKKYKKIKNIDTGEVFDSIKSACQKYGIAGANITKCCKGERNRAGGYRWKFFEDK